MYVAIRRVPLRRLLPQAKSWSRLNIGKSIRIYAFAASSLVLPASPNLLNNFNINKEFLGETIVKCPVHSYIEPIRNQVEKIKEEVVPKSIIQSILSFTRNISSCLHLCFRAVQICVIFTPLVLSSWMLYIPKLRHFWYMLVVSTLQVGGSSFMKLGQWCATRPDVLPIDLCKELSKLHSTAKEIAFSKIKDVLENELGRPFEEVFEELDPNPIGSGCIAQVYKARIRNSENWVVLKVKRPEVEDAFNCDLKLFTFFANVLQYLPFMSYVNPAEAARLFCKTMGQQLDFRIEAINLLRFRENYRDDDQFVFPLPYFNLSTSSLLVESFEQGIPLANLLEHSSQKNRDIAHLGILGFLHMLLVDNFLHADLHPGNILVRDQVPCKIPLSKSICHRSFSKREVHPQLVFLDCGLVNILEESQKQNFVDLFMAIAKGDGYEAARLLIERAPQPSPPVIDPEGFINDIGELVNQNMDNGAFNLAKLEIANALTHLMASSLSHHVTIDSRFVNLFMSVIILEGVGRQLDPNVNIIASALPIISYSIPEYGEAALTAIRHSKIARRSILVSTKTTIKNMIKSVVKRNENGQELQEKQFCQQNQENQQISSLTNIYDLVEIASSTSSSTSG